MATNNNSFIIRRTDVSDIDSLQQIEKSAVRLFLDSPYPELAGFESISKQTYIRHIEQDHAIFVTSKSTDLPASSESVHGDAVGFALTAPIDDGLHLHELSVHCDFQRQGLGYHLLCTVIRHANDHDYSFVSLTTYRDIDWNGPFYRKAGFATVTASEMKPSLGHILNTEITNGANRETRCVMLLNLRQNRA